MRLIFLTLLLLTSITSISQKTHIIEPAIINVEYRQTKTASRHYELRVGKTASSYFQIEEFKKDSLMEIDPEAALAADLKWIQEYINSPMPPEEKAKMYDIGPGTMGKYYFGLEKGKISRYDFFRLNHLVTKEDIPEMEWRIYEDSTKQIMGYECTMATTDFRGRFWVAWFTPDIPIDAGPWKLHGLPGLIMEAKFDNYATITCIGINANNPKPVTFYNFGDRKYKEIDRLKFVKMERDLSAQSKKDEKDYLMFELK